MSGSESALPEPRLARLEETYDTVLRPVVDAFYATVRSNGDVGPFAGEGLVGLLTFPNSGTSWFLELTARASRICNHTVYEHEARTVGGAPHRGVHSLRFPNAVLPGIDQPSFVKSHMRNYGTAKTRVAGRGGFQKALDRWLAAEPANCDRHVRLVRNPLDNMRARFHLHLKNHVDPAAADAEDFRAFFRADLRRYLEWHAYCDELAAAKPVLSLHYEDLLDPATAAETIGRAMAFAGYRMDDLDIGRALSVAPPSYSAANGRPVHLGHFDEDDLYWAAVEIGDWLVLHERIRKAGQGLAARLRQAVRREGKPS